MACRSSNSFHAAAMLSYFLTVSQNDCFCLHSAGLGPDVWRRPRHTEGLERVSNIHYNTGDPQIGGFCVCEWWKVVHKQVLTMMACSRCITLQNHNLQLVASCTATENLVTVNPKQTLCGA